MNGFQDAGMNDDEAYASAIQASLRGPSLQCCQPIATSSSISSSNTYDLSDIPHHDMVNADPIAPDVVDALIKPTAKRAFPEAKDAIL